MGGNQRRRNRNYKKQNQLKDNFSSPIRNKFELLNEVLRGNLVSHEIDTGQLRILACSFGGLVNKSIRSRAWLHLLDFNGYEKVPSATDANYAEISSERNQIFLDVDRSFHHFHDAFNPSKEIMELKRKSLDNILNAFVVRNPSCSYYQGFHDVCCVVMLVVGETRALGVIEKISHSFFRDHHRPEGFQYTMAQLELLRSLLGQADEAVYDFIQKSQVGMFFAMPWIITGFSHSITELESIARVWDVMLSSHPLFILYLSAALVVYPSVKTRLLSLECDSGIVHHFLQNLPCEGFQPSISTVINSDQLVNLEDLISNTLELMSRIPPQTLLFGKITKHMKLSLPLDSSVCFPEKDPAFAFLYHTKSLCDDFLYEKCKKKNNNNNNSNIKEIKDAVIFTSSKNNNNDGARQYVRALSAIAMGLVIWSVTVSFSK